MRSTRAEAVFILGDLFEAWPGDDAASEAGFEAECISVLREAASERALYFMHGNRDFMVGEAFLARHGVTLLPDPTLLEFAGSCWLLTHGDLLCLEDTEYLAFRAQVRDPAWQRQVLQLPLAQRRAMAQQLRAKSEAKQAHAQVWADVDEDAAKAWLAAADAAVMIHGHTHRPKDHALGDGRRRIVLTDWDAASRPPRLEALRVDAAGARRVALD
jgi:UDP-2,3-diacylglucosamine hydrolase